MRSIDSLASKRFLRASSLQWLREFHLYLDDSRQLLSAVTASRLTDRSGVLHIPEEIGWLGKEVFANEQDIAAACKRWGGGAPA